MNIQQKYEELTVIKCPRNSCMMPTKMLDSHCGGCPWSFTCSININGTKSGRLKPVKVSVKPSKGKVCSLCGGTKPVIKVAHRVEWDICEECLLTRTDFLHAVSSETWAEMRKKMLPK